MYLKINEKSGRGGRKRSCLRNINTFHLILCGLPSSWLSMIPFSISEIFLVGGDISAPAPSPEREQTGKRVCPGREGQRGLIVTSSETAGREGMLSLGPETRTPREETPQGGQVIFHFIRVSKKVKPAFKLWC